MRVLSSSLFCLEIDDAVSRACESLPQAISSFDASDIIIIVCFDIAMKSRSRLPLGVMDGIDLAIAIILVSAVAQFGSIATVAPVANDGTALVASVKATTNVIFIECCMKLPNLKRVA